MQKEFLSYVFSAQRNSNFCEKGVTKIEPQNGQLFRVLPDFYSLQPNSYVYNYIAKYDS